MVAQIRTDVTCTSGKTADLRRVPLFADLDNAALADVAAHSRRRIQHAGVWVVEERDARERTFLIARGSVRLYRVTPDGHEVTLSFKHDGALFDFQGGDGAGRRTDDAEALFDGTIIYDIPRAWLGRFAHAHPIVLYNITLMLREVVRESRDIAVDRSRAVEIRVAHALPRIAGPRDAVELTRCCLATVVQASREEVGRALKRLRAAGLVAYRDNERVIRLLDKDALAAWEESALL